MVGAKYKIPYQNTSRNLPPTLQQHLLRSGLGADAHVHSRLSLQTYCPSAPTRISHLHHQMLSWMQNKWGLNYSLFPYMLINKIFTFIVPLVYLGFLRCGFTPHCSFCKTNKNRKAIYSTNRAVRSTKSKITEINQKISNLALLLKCVEVVIIQ